MERVIRGVQTAYCPKFEEFRDIDLVICETTTLGDIKHYGFKENGCPDLCDCEHADQRHFCLFVKNVLDRFARGG